MATTKIPLGTFRTGTKVIKDGIELSTMNVETKYLHNVIFRTKNGKYLEVAGDYYNVFNVALTFVNNINRSMTLNDLHTIFTSNGNNLISCVGSLGRQDLDQSFSISYDHVVEVGYIISDEGDDVLSELVFHTLGTKYGFGTASNNLGLTLDSSTMEIIDTFTPIVEVE